MVIDTYRASVDQGLETHMAQINIIGRAGVLTAIRIDGVTDDIYDAINRYLRSVERDGETMTAVASKKEIIWLHSKLATLAPAPTVAIAPAHSSAAPQRRRRIELASRAGSNAGRAWIANGYTIDKHSLPPEWEGELVCYVYEN